MKNPDGQWHIRLFGALEVDRPTGESVRLNGKKAGELLAYLALSPGQAHSRKRLITLLWGDTDVNHAGTRLRQEIAALRALFAADNGSSSVLHITATELQIQVGPTIDAVRFLQVCSEAKQEPEGERKAQLLSDACRLYRADLLTEYDAGWIATERLRIGGCYARTLHALAETHWQRRDYAGAEEILHRLLAHNPLNEESHLTLMRLYAEQSQPTRVQQQYQVLEHALQESADLGPTEGTRRLAEALRESAGRRATLIPAPASHVPDRPNLPTAEESASMPVSEPKEFREPTGIPVLQAGRASFLPVIRRRFVRLLPVFLLLVLSAGFWFWKTSHRSRPLAASRAASVWPLTPKWTYLYAPEPGEMPNAEGRAIATIRYQGVDAIYVTGLIQTKKQDTNILTLRLSLEGKLIWKDCYDSPEHDCDRAYSLCPGGPRHFYVLGETYFPSSASWHLTLLYFDMEKGRQWVRRSPLSVQNEEQMMKVCSDGQGGCYVGGTALVKRTQAALIMHYDHTGKLLWQRTVREGMRTWFHWLAVSSDGTPYFCGTARRGKSSNGINDDWLIVCLEAGTGKVKWQDFADGPAHGSDSADRMTLDRGGNILVAGVFDTGDITQGGTGRTLGLLKYASDGTRLWRKVAKDTGPNVCLNSISSNFEGSIALGGTEQENNGSMGIDLVRYDSNGYQKQTWRYPLPPGFVSASVSMTNIGANNGIGFMGQVSRSRAMQDESSLLISGCNIDGSQGSQLLFNPVPGQPNGPADFSACPGGYVLTGQAGLANGQHALCVLAY